MIIPSGQPFYILVNNVLDRLVRGPKHIVGTQCTPPWDVLQASKIEDQNVPLIEIKDPEVDAQPTNPSIERFPNISVV